GEVERRDARADAEGLQPRMRVDAAADLLRIRAFQQLGSADSKFDDLDAALNGSHRIEKHLAVLLADEGGQLLLVLFDKLAKLVEDARAAYRGCVAPSGKRGRRGL